MITKERLEELIKQGATIWYVIDDTCILEKILNNTYEVDSAYLWRKIKNGAVRSCGYLLEDLFETKEQAEEYFEFGNITKTEKLELPTWREVQETMKTNYSYEIVKKYDIKLVIEDNSYSPAQIILISKYEKYNWNLTKENYNEARRLCKKLFLGEEI